MHKLLGSALTITLILPLTFSNGTEAGTIDDSHRAANLIEGLSPKQQDLWGHYLELLTQAPSSSQVVTFTAITHALEHTKLHNGMSALDLVERVKNVAGEMRGAPSAKQFLLSIVWKVQAPNLLMESGFSFRIGMGHQGEWGMSYHGSAHGLHFLFYRANPIFGDVHVDYRKNISEGHFKDYNSDVCAIGPQRDVYGPIDNYKRHVEWFGLIPNFSH